MPAKLLRRVLLSRIWQLHQRGHFGWHEAAQRLAQLPFLADAGWAANEIAHVLHNRVVTAVPCMAQLLDVLHEQLHLRLFCICNASSEELARLRRQFPAVFAKFHTTFASGEEGVGKPSLRFLQVVMEKAGICANRTLYLDSHDLESIIAARSLGMPAVRLMPMKNTNSDPVQLYLALIRDTLNSFPPLMQHPLIPCKTLYPLSSTAYLSLTIPRKTEAYSNPLRSRATSKAATPILSLATPTHRWSTALSSARRFLLRNGANDPNKLIQHSSLTSDGVRIHDNFAQFVMADLLSDTRFLPMLSPPVSGLICFINKTPNLANQSNTVMTGFNGNSAQFDSTLDACTFIDFPEDLDTTSIGLSVLHKFGKVGMETIHKVLDKMLGCVSGDDGILQVYFDSERPRIDPVAMANAIFLFHLAKRGHEVEKSERFVESVLLYRAYEEGTLYYNLGEAFLVSVARLVHRFQEHFTHSGMRHLLVTRLQEQATQSKDGNTSNILALVLRLRACALCCVEEDAHAKEEVGRAQKENGNWDGCGYYRYGSNAQSWIGNEGLTTAYAYASLLPL